MAGARSSNPQVRIRRQAYEAGDFSSRSYSATVTCLAERAITLNPDRQSSLNRSANRRLRRRAARCSGSGWNSRREPPMVSFIRSLLSESPVQKRRQCRLAWCLTVNMRCGSWIRVGTHRLVSARGSRWLAGTQSRRGCVERKVCGKEIVWKGNSVERGFQGVLDRIEITQMD